MLFGPPVWHSATARIMAMTHCAETGAETRLRKTGDDFYAPQLYLRRVLAMGILSVCPSVCLSRPGGIPSPGKINTPGLHRMIA